MELQTMCFLFGAILLAIAILGGGFEVKEIKVPTVGQFGRWLSGVIGAVFIIIAFYTWSNAPAKTPTAPIPMPSQTESPAKSLQSKKDLTPEVRRESIESKTSFSIRVSLGRVERVEELETAMRIFVDGNKVAEFHLDSRIPSQSVSVDVPKPGDYKYMIEGYTIWSTSRTRRIPLRGSGVISVNRGATFCVESNAIPTATIQTWVVYLVAD